MSNSDENSIIADQDNHSVSQRPSENSSVISEVKMDSSSSTSENGSFITLSEYIADSLPEDAIITKPLKSLEIRMQVLEGSVGSVSPESAEFDLHELNSIKVQIDELFSKNYEDSLASAQLTLGQRCRNLRNKYVRLIERKRSRSSAGEGVIPPGATPLKLPAIDIPQFDGKIEKWNNFKSLFLTLVNDDRVRNNDTHKKSYLFKAVHGEARSLIENLEDEENFENLWGIVSSHYDDPRRRANTHLHQVLKGQPGNSLRQRLVFFRQHAAGLKSAYNQLKLDPFEQIIISLFLDCDEVIKPGIKLAWQRRVVEKRAAGTLASFYQFIEEETLSTERAFGGGKKQHQKVNSQVSKGAGPYKTAKKGHVLVANASPTQTTRKCELCDGSHYLNQCSTFKGYAVEQREAVVKEKTLCPVCFKATCRGAKEKSAFCSHKHLFCYKCKSAHHWLLHKTGKSAPPLSFTNTSIEVRKCVENVNENISICLFNTLVTRKVQVVEPHEPLLATVLVNAMNEHMSSVKESRALLDNGSQFNFITMKLVNALALKIRDTNVFISGVGNNKSKASKCVDVTLVSRYNSFQIRIECLVLDSIVNSVVPSRFFDVTTWDLPTYLHLADPYFNVPGEINLLLGLDVFCQVLKIHTHALGSNLPKLKETEFGWITAGSLRTTETSTGTMVFFVQLSNNKLLQQIEKFWAIEQHKSTKAPLTEDELQCESIFEKTTYRQEDGRFVVSLPFKKDPALLGDSRFEALKQFMHLERRLQNNAQMRENYITCMREYIKLGHMKEISELPHSGPSYYLSHHAVINPSSTSTSQRTVFNASMKSTSGYSLNDLLHTGPKVQPDLISILMRFRLYRYVMSADIIKMYRQFLMNKSHTIFQRIFWRESPDQPLKVHELTTVSFGERSAPYSATKCLNDLGAKYGTNYPNAKPVILNDFYVDNALTGSDSLAHALAIQEELITLLNSAGLSLSKWCSNVPELLAKIDPQLIETSSRISFDDMGMIKTLGMYWSPGDDTLRISFEKSNVTDAKTKRQILGVIASIFDPMGLVGPVTVAAKCFMQEIWKCTVESFEGQENLPKVNESGLPKKQNIHWDDLVPDNILIPWQNFASNLHKLNTIKIPRHLLPNLENAIFELHGFADASSKAYGAVIYCRAISKGQVVVSLLRSRSRVAPLQELSITRLELCAAHMLVELMEEVVSTLTLKTNINCIRLWSDSKVVLSWIASPSYRWSVFVSHRVSKIQTSSRDCYWDYVQSASNPADTLSRGANPEELAANQEWFFGPTWLRSSDEPWTDKIDFIPSQNVSDERRPLTGISMLAQSFQSEFFTNISLPDTGTNSTALVYVQGYIKLLRLVAYCARMIRHSLPYIPRPIRSKTGMNLRIHDLAYAHIILVKLAQAEYFNDEIRCIQNGLPLAKLSGLKNLNPFIDIDGVLRVGGRLEHSEMSYEQRHPIILHPSHKLTTLIVLHEHLANLHAGPKLVSSFLRRQYWIIRLNSCISRCLNMCVTCVKFVAKTQTQIMADLPKERVAPSKPFTHTGVDYAGPFWLLQKGGRNRSKYKAYIAVFACFATKAIHLEVVSDLTTDAFLEALSRFISRRGIPAHIHSDNGTTFVGAKGAIREMYDLVRENGSQIERFALNHGIQWHFIPPRAPHFGGLWEASVKSVKCHLYRTVHTYTLVYEQFTTVLAQIEACLNSRPLTAESSDPNALSALTPGHFLIGGPINALPSINYTSVPDNRLKHWQKIQKLTQIFWKRWSTEYLNTLQQRYKWREEKDDIKINDVVLIRDDNLAPTQWKLGRITELYPGRDGKMRVALLRTSSGEFKRPLAKLVLLPNGDNS